MRGQVKGEHKKGELSFLFLLFLKTSTHTSTDEYWNMRGGKLPPQDKNTLKCQQAFWLPRRHYIHLKNCLQEATKANGVLFADGGVHRHSHGLREERPFQGEKISSSTHTAG
jgi:hypothetical protein